MSIRYTLLVGKPPFETSCLKETYIRIKKNEYSVPRVCIFASGDCLLYLRWHDMKILLCYQSYCEQFVCMCRFHKKKKKL